MLSHFTFVFTMLLFSHVPLVLSRTSFPANTPTDAVQDMATVRGHRLAAIVGSGTGQASHIASWMSTLDPGGKWPDAEINYASGCDAQRANWPAVTHWSRIVTMAASYRADADAGKHDTQLRQAVTKAMDFWFSRDFVPRDCLYNGGTPKSKCPCGTPGLWNTNWFSNVILVPKLVAETCMVLNDTLTRSEADNCTHIATRAYSPFYESPAQGFVAGANILDMAQIGIDQGLRILNFTLVSEAYGRVHDQMSVQPGIKVDGIKADGSFGQHTGLLYNGDYGSVFSGDVLSLEKAAAGTRFAASDSAQSLFATLFDGDKWMIYYNTARGVLQWDYSALPRFIAFPVSDNQPNAKITINLSDVADVGKKWGSATLMDFAASLSKKPTSANAGDLVGNRMLYSNDYMVHRGANYVATLKMYSSRTKNTEFTNSANPFGFHLADGALYTHIDGGEYEDIAAAWDWNKIPGITTDYGATPLTGSKAGHTGIESFVGGATAGAVGIAALRYTNPITKGFSFSKAWFFLPGDVQRVMVAGIISKSAAPVISVLDQKRRSGPVMLAPSVTGALKAATANASTLVGALWHHNVGYTFETPLDVSFATGTRTGKWSDIGTSKAKPASVDLFAAWISHKNTRAPVAYTAFPGASQNDFDLKRRAAATAVHTIANDGHIMAVWNDKPQVGAVVFWDAAGGSVTFPNGAALAATAHAAIVYEPDAKNLTVADPSQTLDSLKVTITRGGKAKVYSFSLPRGPGGKAGSSVTHAL